MNQLSIRGMSPELEREVRALSRREGISMNKAVLRLLGQGMGIGPMSRPRLDRVGPALDRFIGSWSPERGEALERALADLEAVDPSLWA